MADLLNKMLSEEQNILAALLRSGGKDQIHHMNTEEQVLTEFALLYQRIEILMAGTDDTEIDINFSIGTDWTNAFS